MINKRYVLTAAHCVNKDLTSVLLGTTDVTLPGKRLQVMATKTHESFTTDYERKFALPFEIAILRLTEDVDFTRFIQPICLPFQVNNYEYPNENTTYIVAGWGEREFITSNNILSKTEIRFHNYTECKNIYSAHKKYFNEKVICAGGEIGKDSCYGDSGGPLIRKLDNTWVLDGIVSDGIGGSCGTLNPGVYTNVIKFEKWIKKNIAELEKESLVDETFLIRIILVIGISLLLIIIILVAFRKLYH